jgi:tetratricopeptide (TPR) repeat protein
VPLASAPTENCPDCEQMKGSPERFRAIERDMQSFMRNIQIDDPAWTSHLYLIRSFVRNKLKRSQEALTDLGSALYFLRSFDVPRNERLALGEGILRAAKGVHGIAPEELMALCDQLLLPEIPATDPRIIRILCHRSEILIGIGQSSVALGDCESMLSIIGSGEVDVDHKTKSRIWYAKEEAERSLGRSDEANASMRQAIIEAEKTTGDGGHLIATLASLSCVYLVSSNPHLARDDLQNVLRILQSQHIKIYEDIWQCLMLLSQTHWECHEVAAALRAAREAVQVAEKHLPSPTSRHEMSLEAVRQIEAGDYKWGDMRDVLRP